MNHFFRALILCLVIVCYGQSQTYFEDISTIVGINSSCGDTYLGNGVSFYDYDGDGWDDITLATGAGEPILVFKNNNGVFTQQTLNLNDPEYQTKQINWVDYDNDGDKDLFVTSNEGRNILYNNDGNFNFQDVTSTAGFPMANLKTYGASWGDYNNDGFLDVFICNRDETFVIPNYLFKNNGDGTFTNVSSIAGIHNTSALSFCAAFFDFNNDGWQDIYVSNDKTFNLNVLYKNNGDGTFTDVSQSSGTDFGIDAMTVTIGDYNNDSFFDIYITNTSTGNVFLKNNGNETFTNIASATGTLFNSIGWGAVFLDADNDTDLDLYVSGSLNGSNPNYLSAAFYNNQGNGIFNIPTNAGFVNDTRESHSNAIGDSNNDGYPEIAVNNTNNQNMFLWSNQPASTKNWLKVKLEGTDSNKDGIGSVIEISINGSKYYKYTLCGEGYLGQNSATQIFGLGSNNTVDYVKVKWLSGEEDMIYNVASNQVLEIVEGTYPLHSDEYPFKNFEIYPNPTNKILNFKSSIPITKISVFNLLGQPLQIFKLNTSLGSINLSSLSSGTYIIKTEIGNHIKMTRVIKE